MRGGYLFNLLVCASQMLNAALWGWPDESLSGRAHRQQDRRRWRVVRRALNGLFFWEPDHCEAAYFSEKTRRHLPPDLR
jgi:hypothetical protein